MKIGIVWKTVICFLLCLVMFSGTVIAGIGLGGKIETTFGTTLTGENKWEVIWQEHLNLKFLLPSMGDTSAKFELDLYYAPQGNADIPDFQGDITKLYIKHKFKNFHLVLGRQPISWSFGSLLNPVDFGQSMGLMDSFLPEKGENAILGYIPLGLTSNLTLVASFPEFGARPKFGLRGRTDLFGYDLTLNYVNSPALMDGVIPAYQQVGFTAKGDLGPMGVYGVTGYHFNDTDFAAGNQVYLIGADYSFYLDYGSKIVTQLEYMYDEARESNLLFPREPHLLTGLISYEIDEFASFSMAVSLNPLDRSFALVPVYKNLIGSGLDLSVSGAIFMGEKEDEFGPGNISQGIPLPVGIVQVGFSYPF